MNRDKSKAVRDDDDVKSHLDLKSGGNKNQKIPNNDKNEAVDSAKAANSKKSLDSEATKTAKVDDEVFNREIKEFFEVLKKVILINDASSNRNKSGINPVLRSLNKYVTVYQRMSDALDHYPFFLYIYKSNRDNILKGPSNDAWLKKDVSLQFGISIIPDKELNPDIRILISTIYLTAIKLKAAKMESLRGASEDAYENAAELNFPDEIILHLYRLFRESVLLSTLLETKPENKIENKKIFDKDYQNLCAIIHEFEDELGIVHDSDIGKNSTSSAGPLNGDSLGNILQQVTKKMNINLPGDSKIPTGDEFQKFLGNLLDDPKAQSTLGAIGESLKDVDKDPRKVATKMMDLIGDDELKEAMNGSIDDVMKAAERKAQKASKTEDNGNEANTSTETKKNSKDVKIKKSGQEHKPEPQSEKVVKSDKTNSTPSVVNTKKATKKDGTGAPPSPKAPKILKKEPEESSDKEGDEEVGYADD